MGLLRTVQRTDGAARGRPRASDARAFFETYEPLTLHDPVAGFSRTDAASLGDIGVARVVSAGHDIGVVDQDCVSLLAPKGGRIVSETSRSTFRSVPRGALLFWPNRRATRVERVDAPLFTAAALRIPLQAVRAAGERLAPSLAERLAGADIALSLDPARMKGVLLLTDYCHAVLEELERPDSLLARPRARDRACTQIIETLVEILEAAGALRDPGEKVDHVAVRRVRAAESYMRANYEDIVSLGEVSRAVGVGDRALQLAFGAVKGETPRRMLAGIRLDAARSRLLAPAEGETVTAAALACGFTHLGRFATAYRARFGETPSATLRRARHG